MVYSNLNWRSLSKYTWNTRRLLLVISGIVLSTASLAIFQDFLESKRSGYAFYFNESLLFKTIWFLYIPILMILYRKLQNKVLNSRSNIIKWISVPVLIHLSILPFIAALFSTVFFNGVYDLSKFFSYSMTHHLGELIAVYSGFVIGYKYFMESERCTEQDGSKIALDTIVINNGKDNVIIQIADIVQITAATPYVSIHLENRRYLHAETLKAICERLDNNTFIRVHKSTIVNISKVRSFKSRLNGDYDLLLTDGGSLRLSRTYAADFKTRFVTGTSG